MTIRTNRLRTRLLLSSALATLTLGYGSRGAYAGVCAPTGGGTYLCAGGENSAADLTQTLTPISPLIVTTTNGFGIDTSVNGGNAFSLSASGGLQFNDLFTSLIRGADSGIDAQNTTFGNLSITTTGSVTGVSYDGIYARNNAGGGDLTIDANNVAGAASGIHADNYGTGATSITATGTVSSSSGIGIYAINDYVSGGMTVQAVDVSGTFGGVEVSTYGTGPVSVTTTGDVTSAGGDGIFVGNGYDGTDLTINANNVSGGYHGIHAENYGTGALTITATGTVTGDNSTAILAINSDYGDTTDLTIQANNVSGAYDGVVAINFGSGTTSVTTTGLVTAGYTDGIFAVDAGNGTGVTISATGGVTGYDDGIKVYNYGSGALSVTTTGTVTGTTDDGIDTLNFGTDLIISAENVTAADNAIKAYSRGTGSVSVTATGTVTGGTDDGITAYNSSNGTGLTVSANNVSGGLNAIRTESFGSGPATVTVSGTVTGGSGAGIATESGPGGTTDIILNSGANVSAASGTAITNDDGDSTVTVNTGASVTGAIQLGGGTDATTFDGGDFSNVNSFDGGAGTDSLTFRNVNGNVAGGSIVNMEDVVIDSDANITIDGTVASDVTVQDGGTLGPGLAPGLTQVLGDVALMAGSTLALEIGGIAVGSQYDRLDVSDDLSTVETEGTATIDAGTVFDIDFFGPFTAGLGDTFDVLVADDISSVLLTAMMFDFTGASLGTGLEWDFSIVDFGGGRDALRLSVIELAEVPEPSVGVIFGTGLLGFAGYSSIRRRRKKAAEMAA
tara:strand:+ start:12107 stop:14470 length:2364 start_codon:yes stop_codon:yes gene_type:complete